ncbi:hypothetical protein [Flagellimonas pacifica]|uniref:Polymer-forming cytoskeletal protein n=1 Tax=Flagellimonas pacifica TaxID=1247520 RepID=A0A285MT39_9FLAO|nr:hypothetical protein [Allomuricauda parva]SNY99697.1 hypothetical protein SAMN06265377_1508 [Allomuricauda parva]
MLRNKKLQAGSLQFVLFIGAVIAVLLLTFTLLHHTHSIFDKKTFRTINLIKRTDFALQKAMKEKLKLNDSVILNLAQDDGIKTTVVKSHWGIFEKYAVISKFKKNKFVKTALVGGRMDEGFSALYLKDNDRPVVIAGNAKITGNVYLPKQGIRPGSIRGQFYQFTNPVYGNVKQSTKVLPPVDDELKAYLRHLLIGGFEMSNETNIRFSNRLHLLNSFESPTQFIQGDVLRLSDVKLRGNILVKATDKIIVSKSANLQDVLLIAPEIEIENGFSGRLQAIASNHIKMNRRVNLEYPSAIIVDRGVTPNPKEPRKPNIEIGSDSSIKGIVAYFERTQENQFFPQVVISEKALVYGEVFCEKNIELKGDVIGNVTTNAFMAMENGSVYQNHLFGGTINVTFLSEQYVGLLLNKQKGVSKWLY